MSDPIKVTLRRESEPNKAHVNLTGPRGESEYTSFELLWLDDVEWKAVFLSLESHTERPTTWPSGEVLGKAQELGLFLQDRPSDDRFKIIGRQLYDTVLGTEEIRSLLNRLLHLETNEIPVVEFHVQDEGSTLQAYPWELLHDGERFLFDGRHAFPVRHVNFEEPIIPFELTENLQVLYVVPRPSMASYEGYTDLPIREKPHLEYLNRYYPEHLALETLPANTLDALQRRLVGSENPVHAIHIDTHGGFGWLCQCKRFNFPKAQECSRCNEPRSSDQIDRGYLAFETVNGDVDWVSGGELGKRLHRRGVKVVVLSACRSGLVGGKSTFNGVAGALVKQHIPAVVAMQFSIEVNQAERFTEFFYWALMNGMSLTEAVDEGRVALSEESRYRPVLYLRTDPVNYRGELFKPKSRLDPPKKLGPREKWIKRLGFKRDPFLYRDGGIDPFLQEYFYFGMKHFHDIRGDVFRLETVFVFGPPGSGKSSMRNVISQWCQKEGILPIVYNDFGPLARKHQSKEGVRVEDHVTQILKTALEDLADLAKESVAEDMPLLEAEEGKIIRNQLWLYVAEYEDEPLREHIFENLLKPSPTIEGALPLDPRELLRRFCRYVAELFGYQCVYILVDPGEGISWLVLESLLSTQRVLELSEVNVAFKFFLKEDFRDRALQIPWINQEQSRRIYDLWWPSNELHALLQARLQGCSERPRFYEALAQLTEEVDELDDRVIELSEGSPRELVAICHRLFSEHSRKWSSEDEGALLITAQEVNEVLKLFEEQHRESALE